MTPGADDDGDRRGRDANSDGPVGEGGANDVDAQSDEDDIAEASRPTAEFVEAIRGADSLAELVAVTGADDEHDAYFAAKRAWATHHERLPPPPAPTGVPGEHVVVDGVDYHVHGITHADTEAEGSYLREHVRAWRDDGAAVYCEQGIRPMYFADVDGVCATDDYRWALAECKRLDIDSHLAEVPAFDGLGEELDSMTARFREATFSLIDDVVGGRDDRLAGTIGALASEFLTSHEDVAVGEDFASFRLTRAAAEDPAQLPALQAHYRKTFLPQPLEREWLRRHDPELELVTHARNERLADYAVYHRDDAPTVHLLVGAAHQPGVAYYLQQHRDGVRDVRDFELVE